MTPMYIYVLEGEHGCKIGISDNPRRRARSIATQSGNPELRLRSALPILNSLARETEGEAHQRLAVYRTYGEWFVSIDCIAAAAAVEAAIVAVTKRYMLTEDGGRLLPATIQLSPIASNLAVIDRFILDGIEPARERRASPRALPRLLELVSFDRRNPDKRNSVWTGNEPSGEEREGQDAQVRRCPTASATRG